MKYWMLLFLLLPGCGKIELLHLPKFPKRLPTMQVKLRGLICEYTCQDGVVATSVCCPGYDSYREFFVGDACPCKPGHNLCQQVGI